MTLALTKIRAYGIEAEEGLNKRYRQFLILNYTAANTDATIDLGTYAGTFWTAVGSTSPGTTALAAIKDIQTRADQFVDIGGESVKTRVPIDSARDLTTVLPSTAISGGSGVTRTLTVTGLLSTDTVLAVTPKTVGNRVGKQIVVLNSAASSGGNATETYTVTGLLTTDTVTAVTQYVDGAGAAVGILSYGDSSGNCAVNGALAVVYNADPGASAKVKVTVLRDTTITDAAVVQFGTPGTGTLSVSFATDPGDGTVVNVTVKRAAGTTTPDAGTYQLAMDATNTRLPNITFASGDAPTTAELILSWVFADSQAPIEAYATA